MEPKNLYDGWRGDLHPVGEQELIKRLKAENETLTSALHDANEAKRMAVNRAEELWIERTRLRSENVRLRAELEGKEVKG